MGKDRKQQAEYDYLKLDRHIGYKMLQRLRNKWRRHNWDVGEFRKARIEKKDSEFVKTKDMYEE